MESGEERKRRTQSNSRSYQPISIFTPKGKRERERKERKRWETSGSRHGAVGVKRNW